MAIPPEIENDLKSNQVEGEVDSGASDVQENHQPIFGPHPDMSSDYNFEDEVQWLPFKFNLVDTPLNKEHQDQLLKLIYDRKEVFSLHDEDLGFWDKLAYTIVTTTNNPVYLPHRTLHKQLQGEARKCLNICSGKVLYTLKITHILMLGRWGYNILGPLHLHKCLSSGFLSLMYKGAG